MNARTVIGGLCAAAALATGGCTPDEVQAPELPGPSPTIEQAVAPTNGLVGEWKLNETSGTTAVDTKNGYNATVFGGAAFVAGTLGNALNLNNGTAGTGGKYAEMPNNATLDNVQEGDYTISAWFYAYSVPSDATVDNRNWAIVAKYGQHMGLFYENSQQFSARHYLAGDVQISAGSSATYSPNAWHHIAGVVSKSGGSVKVYVDGTLQGTATFAANTAAKEYNTNPFRIGRARINWAADGKVDQVRVYNRALSASEVADLHEETEGSAFRFPVGMFKGPQISLLGMSHTPDGQMTAGSPSGVTEMLDSAQARDARITLRVTGGNENFQTNGDRIFVLSEWKTAFNDVSSMNLSEYVADGTLIGHYAIDEPFSDFDNMTSGFLEDMCEYQKSFAGWRSVPCLVREKNTRLYEHSPTGGYQYVDAGWAQIADHHYDQEYNNNMQAYFQDNLTKGRAVGLGLMYGFNLLNGGREFAGCAQPGSTENCAMTASEIREVADALENLGSDQGCGVMGWEIADQGPARDYFFSTGIQSALQYLNSQVGGLRPGTCNIRGDLPAP